ncbi:transaldolase [Pediococcus pentosaceus]|uniref:transaldolase n=1 Tax=Pediococcus pentosaceus TaxID=1255 RepID=UPI001050F7A9|nr:transaldolase [Pediococcus pentosaceus]
MMDTSNLKIKIYADGADINDIREASGQSFVSGFTTNPSLLKKAGVLDYLKFAREVVAEFPNKDISFEVFSNKPEEMLKEAQILHDLGDNVYVKIPIITTDGKSTADVIKKLSEAKINLNITAITTLKQVEIAENNLYHGTKNLISIFVGRLADAGINPEQFIKTSVEITKSHPEAALLWASTREVYNIFEAQQIGVDIITVPPVLIKKLGQTGKSALEVSLDTVKGFEKDIKTSGLSIL